MTVNLTNIIKGCECPQKSMYVSILLLGLCIPLGAVFNKNGKSKEAISLLIVMIISGLFWYFTLQWCCEKKYNTVAWVLLSLPFLSALYTGYVYSNLDNIKNILSPKLKL